MTRTKTDADSIFADEFGKDHVEEPGYLYRVWDCYPRYEGNNPIPKADFQFQRYRIVKETPSSWVIEMCPGLPKTKVVPKGFNGSWAHPTKRQALINFMHRRAKAIEIARSNIARFEANLRLMEQYEFHQVSEEDQAGIKLSLQPTKELYRWKQGRGRGMQVEDY